MYVITKEAPRLSGGASSFCISCEYLPFNNPFLAVFGKK
jgi:hypothetical protein